MDYCILTLHMKLSKKDWISNNPSFYHEIPFLVVADTLLTEVEIMMHPENSLSYQSLLCSTSMYSNYYFKKLIK